MLEEFYPTRYTDVDVNMSYFCHLNMFILVE